jgi:hypothetical protein
MVEDCDPWVKIKGSDVSCQVIYPCLLALGPVVMGVSRQFFSWPVVIGNFIHSLSGCGTGEFLRTEDFPPFPEEQFLGQHEAVMLMGPATDLEEQFGSCPGEGNIPQFINHQEMESLELFVQSLKPLFFPALYQLGNQVHARIEANASALGTSGKGQGADQMCLAGSRVSDEEHVFFFIQVFPPQKLPDQWLYSICSSLFELFLPQF